MRKVLAVARKEMHQVLRDVRTLLIALLVPIFLLWLYGYALNFDIRHVRLAVADRDHSIDSRDIVSAFVNSGYFDLVSTIDDDREIGPLLDRGEVRAVLVIPENVSRDLRSGRDARVQLLIDGDNANTATTVMGYATAIVGGISAALRVARLGRDVAPPVTLEPRVWFNPELKSTLFLVPGLIGFIAMIMAVILTSLSIVREKELGTMEQVRMAPLGAVSYVVGKAVPYLILSFLSSMGILLAAIVLFDMPVRGSWLLLMAITALFLVGALGWGLLVSTLSDSQQIAFQIALLSSFLPTLILSGFIFPIASMPRLLQYLTYVFPARYYLTALRGILLKGVGVDQLLWPFAQLLVFAVVILALASVRLAREWK